MTVLPGELCRFQLNTCCYQVRFAFWDTAELQQNRHLKMSAIEIWTRPENRIIFQVIFLLQSRVNITWIVVMHSGSLGFFWSREEERSNFTNHQTRTNKLKTPSDVLHLLTSNITTHSDDDSDLNSLDKKAPEMLTIVNKPSGMNPPQNFYHWLSSTSSEIKGIWLTKCSCSSERAILMMLHLLFIRACVCVCVFVERKRRREGRKWGRRLLKVELMSPISADSWTLTAGVACRFK